jgi:hypothetical protein
VAYIYEAEAHGYIPMKLDLQASQAKKKTPRNCITPEVKEKVVAQLQDTSFRKPLRQALIEGVLNSLLQQPHPRFNQSQLKKILGIYSFYGLMPSPKEKAYKYAQFILGCQPLTSEDKAYLSKAFDMLDNQVADPKIMDDIIQRLLTKKTDIV